MAKKQGRKPGQFGYLPPQHKFFLNPYQDARFTRCPKCDRPNKLRKKPLLILISPAQPLSLNKTCRYCPNCDILIAHKDDLDELLERICLQHYPDLVGHDYLVVGTMERKNWKEGLKIESLDELFQTVHDFKKHVEFEPVRYVWMKED
ncbi:hypothetical protein IQ273_18290 [Nodosilinea sp. LEGE 07298]|uniref:hypothetical protein n=1 Tax=Nodosilinea sp. LEGE 07298 TaxID=2777970 RepID=UPI001880CB88|nr:hypothetical protein [Nodosilinea sp. LEGE 07298]MBE9111358.1 hypothetical protein [Nodosilinea sp. LEGE 07298]